MKSTPAPLVAHAALGTTTLALIVKFIRRDGFVLNVTLDHDRPIPFEGDVYQPALGMIPSNIETSGDLSVDNLDAKGALMVLGIAEADIAAGLWDLCEVRVRHVNWADPSMGADKMKRGYFGEISIGRDSFSNEVRGITQKLQQTIGTVVSASCKNDYGDSRCGIVFEEGVRKFSGTPITSFASKRLFTATALTQAAGFFSAGKVTWTTGANAGLSMEIRTHTAGGVIELQEPMPYSIAVDDEATFFRGCLKREEDCIANANILRYGGFPRVPGQDQMFRGV